MSAVCSPVCSLSLLAGIELPLLLLIYVTRDGGGAPHLVQIHFAIHKSAFCNSQEFILQFKQIYLQLGHKCILQFKHIQCGRSSPSQRWGADLRPQCTVKIKKTLKTFTKRSKELPEIFKIVLRPLWWATGSEQPSPPLHPLTVRGLLNSFQLFLVASDFFPPSTQYFSFFGKSYFCWTESWTHGRSMAELMHSIHPTPAVYDCCFFWLHWISFHQAHNISHFSFLVHLIFLKDNNSNF